MTDKEQAKMTFTIKDGEFVSLYKCNPREEYLVELVNKLMKESK